MKLHQMIQQAEIVQQSIIKRIKLYKNIPINEKNISEKKQSCVLKELKEQQNRQCVNQFLEISDQKQERVSQSKVQKVIPQVVVSFHGNNILIPILVADNPIHFSQLICKIQKETGKVLTESGLSKILQKIKQKTKKMPFSQKEQIIDKSLSKKPHETCIPNKSDISPLKRKFQNQQNLVFNAKQSLKISPNRKNRIPSTFSQNKKGQYLR